MADDLVKLQRKIIAKVYSRVAAVVVSFCDEGDRIYFGSSNDADILRDLKDEWDAHRIMGEDLMSSEQEVAALKKRAKADADRITALQAQNRKLVEAATRLLTWAEGEAEGYRACYEIPGTSEIQNASDAEFMAKIDGLLSEVRAALVSPSDAHPDDLAVDRFADAMKAKLAKKRTDGRGGWEGPDCTNEFLSCLLREHVEKGDPLDVGNLAMMLHQRGERIVSPGDGWRPTHRHKKRGSTYVEVGRGKLQTDTPLTDYAELVVYRAEDGTIWVRPVGEFEDGRFERIAPPASEGA